MSTISNNFEIFEVEEGFLLEFPEHIPRDQDHDVILTASQLEELILVLAMELGKARGLL